MVRARKGIRVAEIALRFGPDVVGPEGANRSRRLAYVEDLRLRTDRRWAEAEMRECDLYSFAGPYAVGPPLGTATQRPRCSEP